MTDFCQISRNVPEVGENQKITLKRKNPDYHKEKTACSYIKSLKNFILICSVPNELRLHTGCVVAAACMSLTQLTENHLFDSTGSIVIGGMLGYVAVFLMKQNARYLIGKSIPQDVVLGLVS